MGKAKTVSSNPETAKVMNRFFEVLELLVASKVIRGKKTYCTLYNIDRANMYKQQKGSTRGLFEMDWIVPLVLDFNVSADWLLTGRGAMFTNKDKIVPQQSFKNKKVSPAPVG